MAMWIVSQGIFSPATENATRLITDQYTVSAAVGTRRASPYGPGRREGLAGFGLPQAFGDGDHRRRDRADGRQELVHRDLQQGIVVKGLVCPVNPAAPSSIRAHP